MGLEDREYLRDEARRYSRFGGGAGAGAFSGARSIVATLIIINVVVFVLDMFTNPVDLAARFDLTETLDASKLKEIKEFSATRLRWLADFLALKSDILFKPWMWWQFLTYGFTHASINTDSKFWHILGNMIVLWFLGKPIENRLGRMEFLKFYLMAIVVSGFGFLLIQLLTGRAIVDLGYFKLPKTVVGASGAVSAVVAMFVILYPKQKLLIWGIVPMPAWVLGILIVGMDVFNSFNPNSSVAGEAHLVGLAFGAAYHFLNWNFRWLKFDWLTDRFNGKPNLKVHKPGKDEVLQRQADAILQKIADQGESSLTGKERRILNSYSKSVRNKRD